jgi:hypothetical protein
MKRYSVNIDYALLNSVFRLPDDFSFRPTIGTDTLPFEIVGRNEKDDGKITPAIIVSSTTESISKVVPC